MQVHALIVGPMVGHTTSYGFRLWGCGPKRNDVIGVARIRSAGSSQDLGPKAFPFVAYYDFVGIVDFGSLREEHSDDSLVPNTLYEYEIGWVEDRTADGIAESLDDLVWSANEKWVLSGTVKTFPDPEDMNSTTTFFLGSCRDNTFLGDKGEGTFRAMETTLQDDICRQTQFILMTGDQIYIDHSHPLPVPAFGLEKYHEEYRRAFSRKNFNAVTRRLPTYMMIDDHEVQNDWSRGQYEREKERRWIKTFHWKTFANAMQANEAYQASLSPVIKSAENFGPSEFPKRSDVEEPSTRYSYKFRHGQCGFFVLDTRSESTVGKDSDNEGDAKILSDDISTGQLSELKKWLIDRKEKFKFIVSPIPVFPDTQKLFGNPKDKWGGAPKQRHEMLKRIFEKRDDNPRVVFLSGDVHVSYVAQLTLNDDDNGFIIYNVVSSAFNWVPPGLQRGNFAWGSLAKKDLRDTSDAMFKSKQVYGPENQRKQVHKKNNFARIKVKGDNVTVQFIRGDGRFSNDVPGQVMETVELTFNHPVRAGEI